MMRALGLLLLGALSACGPEPTVTAGLVWLPDEACWEERDLEAPVPYLDDFWQLYVVDEHGNCWFIEGTPHRPAYWGPSAAAASVTCPEEEMPPRTLCGG
jgi:hypothetical protein